MIPLLLPLFLCAPDAPAGFVLLMGDASGNGTVRMCTVSSSQFNSIPELTGIRLLDCAPTSRTPLDESFPGRALLRDDLEQGTRVQLPGGNGSIYHYVRTDALSSTYGFFAVDAAGVARVLIEMPAAPGPSDPFVGSVACKSSGASMLVATQANSGGDLWELHLDGSPALNRTASLPPQVFGRDSYFLSPLLGVAVSTTAVLRFDPATPAEAAPVGFGAEATPAWLGLELMPSANGRFVAFLAGDSATSTRPFVVGASGDAACMNSVPDFLSGAGCLPEVQAGPWLAVSDDGMQCAWRVGQSHTDSYSHELYMSRRNGSGTPVAFHVTQDPLFEPYLDEIGLAFYRPSGQLVFMAGDPGANGALLSRADLFSAAMDDTGAVQLANMSLTSGNPVPPFLDYGTIELFDLRVRAGSGEALLYSREAGGHRLLHLDSAANGVQMVQDGVEGVSVLDPSGGEWVVGMDVPAGDHQTGLSRLETDSAPELELMLGLPTLGGATRLMRNGNEPDWYSCICSEGQIEHLWQVDASNGTVRLFSARDLNFGRSMAYASDGSLILSLHVGNSGSFFVVWPQNAGSHRLWLMPQPGFVLPGA